MTKLQAGNLVQNTGMRISELSHRQQLWLAESIRQLERDAWLDDRSILRHMAASGLGITVLPALAVPVKNSNDPLKYIQFDQPIPARRVVLVWRKSYSRAMACEALAQAVRECGLLGVSVLL